MQTFFLNYLFFLQFLYLERKFLGLSLKHLRRGCNQCNLRVNRKVLRKKICIFQKKYKFYFILWDWEENFGWMVNTAFTEAIGSLCRSFFQLSVFFHFFTLSETLSAAFRQKLVSKVVITAFFVSIGSYWGKKIVWFFEKIMTLLPASETARKTSAWWSTMQSPRKWDLYADLFFRNV